MLEDKFIKFSFLVSRSLFLPVFVYENSLFLAIFSLHVECVKINVIAVESINFPVR